MMGINDPSPEPKSTLSSSLSSLASTPSSPPQLEGLAGSATMPFLSRNRFIQLLLALKSVRSNFSASSFALHLIALQDGTPFPDSFIISNHRSSESSSLGY